MNKTVLRLVFSGLFFIRVARAEPVMPVGFVATAASAENSTWREFGHLPVSYVMAVQAVKAAMLAQGYSEKHDIESDEKTARRVMLWEKEGEKIILMVWEIEIAKTGCAWGVSND